jgi:hypothetical protein
MGLFLLRSAGVLPRAKNLGVRTMSDDLLKRARLALQKPDTNRPQLPAPGQAKPSAGYKPPAVPDPKSPKLTDAKGAELLARAQAASAAAPKQTLVAAAPPAPRVERVKLPMTCSVTGSTYVVIAERHGDKLHFVGHEIPPPGAGGAAKLPGRLSGRYRIEANGWACPLCRNAVAVWLCDCDRMNGAMHCHGARGGRYRCACGRIEEREFESIPTVEVRGASVAATPDMKASGIQQRGQSSQLKQVSYEPNR